MANFHQALVSYWNANKNLPKLYFEYAPEEEQPPIAVYAVEGYRRDYGNVNFKIDLYRCRFVIMTLSPETAFETGMFVALPFMEQFTYTGLFMNNPEPDSLATPSKAGQASVWEYGFNIDFHLQVQQTQGV